MLALGFWKDYLNCIVYLEHNEEPANVYGDKDEPTEVYTPDRGVRLIQTSILIGEEVQLSSDYPITML